MNILELAILKQMVGGGGGSGTDNYNDLSNLPQINGETLAGNKSAENLGLQDALTFDSTPTEDSPNPVESGGVYSELAKKQDNLTFNGTYDASTNKAATESTVTNAINELDVSETSFDADETIDTISETDGKITVTKKDIAIASNQVTSMTGYTKPSSAPANPAIQTNDTANQAFGKLEFKADTNQTNILYGLNRNAKNLIDFKFNDMPTQGTGFYWDTACDLPAGTYSISFLLTSTAQVGLYVTVDGSEISKFLQTGTKVSHEYTFTANSAITSIKFWLNGGTNIIYDFMISLKDVYDADPTYESYSAPNYDLTRLESEDRASLAEVVDSGAKNKAEIYSTSANSINISVSGYTATFSGTSSAAGSIEWCNIHVDKTGDYILYYKMSTPAGRLTVKNKTDGTNLGDYYNTKNETPIVLSLISGKNYVISSWFASGSASACAIDIMICTSVEFKVSPKLVPYRLSYNTLGKLKWKSYNIGLSTVSFIKSSGGVYYYSYDVSSDFSTLLAVTINGFEYLPNIGYSAIMNATNRTIGIMVHDPSAPQSLIFNDGNIRLMVLGFE